MLVSSVLNENVIRLIQIVITCNKQKIRSRKNETRSQSIGFRAGIVEIDNELLTARKQ